MNGTPRAPLVDFASLAETLTALGYPVRLQLLDILRDPHAVGEIRLAPARSWGGENPERAASKQAVQAHLDKLVDVGLVRVEEIEANGRALNRYVANASRVYALIEDLRRLSVRYAGRPAGGDATGTLDPSAPPKEATGPRLTLVHGVYEGKSFPLSEATAREGRWVIGRTLAASVALDYDPFVSKAHAAVARDGTGFVLQDIPESKNGSQVNWVDVPRGGSRRLKAGDVIGVGRSLLVFVPE